MSRLLWTQKQDLGPLPRVGHAMAFDSDRGRIVLFGGDSLRSNLFKDTWEWEGEDWTQIADIGPSARWRHAMAYDDVRKSVVLFGGNDGTGVAGDTWAWDGNNWTQLADTGAPARQNHAMVFDSARQRVVLFGGRGNTSAVLGDTWEWDGLEWTQQEDMGVSPRERHVMAYDSARGRVVLFGGLRDGAGLGDTWEWNGTSWRQVADFGPDPCCASTMIYKGETVELFGGVSSLNETPPPRLIRNTWEWDGKHWSQRQDMGPSARWGHAAAMDRKRGRVVLFGGLSVFSSENPETSDGLVGDTWEHSVEVVLESFTISPTIASPGQPLIILTVTLNIPAPPGGVAVLISSLEQISGGLPKTIFIEAGTKGSEGEISLFSQAPPGPAHTITASLGKSTKTVSLEIRG